MDWPFVLTIFFTIIFGIATIILAFKLAKKKKPAWAKNTEKIIGIETGAPPELKLYFGKGSVSDVWKTLLVFLNKGNESIREDDISMNIYIHFKGARILRQPRIKEYSRDAIRFTAKQVIMGDDASIQLGFRYLGHNDGAVIEVLHTGAQEIFATGDVMDAHILAISEYDPYRSRPGYKSLVGGFLALVLSMAILISYSYLLSKIDIGILATTFFVVGASLMIIAYSIRDIFLYRKFPSWSRLKKESA